MRISRTVPDAKYMNRSLSDLKQHAVFGSVFAHKQFPNFDADIRRLGR